MKTKVGGGAEYVTTGTIIEASAGKVDFILNPLAIEEPGIGAYIIIGDDGTYQYTYEKGEFEILSSVL
jgi:hypothetical protein